VQPVEVVPEFRCETCAVLEVDQAAKRNTRNALKLIAVGGVLMLLAVLMWQADFNPGYDSERPTDGMGALFYVATAGSSCVVIGLGMLKFRRRVRR
jgi:hypothetical protein